MTMESHFKLRRYQTKAIEDIRLFFAAGGKHCILQAPTGAGKTCIFAYLAHAVAKKTNKILIISNRTELLYQSGGAISSFGLKSFYIEAGCKNVNHSFNCYVSMAQTLRNRIELPNWIEFIKSINLFIIDELHLQDFNYLFESGLLNDKYLIGFTATPLRSGKMRQLGLDYEKIISTIQVRELIEQNYLVNDDYFGCMAPKMDGVKIDRMSGDYQENQMFAKFNTTTLYAGLVKNYNDLTPNTKAICFCVNIEHCVQTTIKLNEAGINARFIVSDVSVPKLPADTNDVGKMARYNERKRIYDLYQMNKELFSGDRDTVIQDFRESKYDVIVNAGILTTGFDCPDVETIILNRATTSLTLLLQMLGRGSRIYGDKTHFNILDFGDNCSRLGFYTENREWSLWHDEVGKGGLSPVKECGWTAEGKAIIPDKPPDLFSGVYVKQGCRRLILAAYDICPFCGFKYPEKISKEVELGGIMFDFQRQQAVRTKRIKDMTNHEIYTYWKEKGHKSAWLWRQLWYKGGELALCQFGKEYKWNYSTIANAVSFCRGM